MATLTFDLEKIAEACRAHQVQQLDLLGSGLTSDYDLARSDVDLVVTFQIDDWRGQSDRYFGLLEALEDVFNRPVDLLEDRAVRNPYLRAEVERSRKPLFTRS